MPAMNRNGQSATRPERAKKGYRDGAIFERPLPGVVGPSHTAVLANGTCQPDKTTSSRPTLASQPGARSIKVPRSSLCKYRLELPCGSGSITPARAPLESTDRGEIANEGGFLHPIRLIPLYLGFTPNCPMLFRRPRCNVSGTCRIRIGIHTPRRDERTDRMRVVGIFP